MKGFKKKLLSFMMSIAIICYLLPTSIFATSGKTVTITTGYLKDGIVRQYYSVYLKAEGEGTITWNITDGSLPSGLELIPDQGIICGTPTPTSPSTTFTVTATNEHGATDSKTLSIHIRSSNEVDIAISTESFQDGFVSKFYSQKLEYKNSENTTFSITEGFLPDGLSLDSDTGVISGTPTKAGKYIFTITAKNNQSGATDSKEFTINIISADYEANEITISGVVKDCDNNVVENVYLQLCKKNGDFISETYTDKNGKYTISGNFPAGDYLIKTNCTSQFINTSRDFTLTGQDITIDIVIDKYVDISTDYLKDGKVGYDYIQNLEYRNGKDVTWSVTDGSLPDGLSLASDTGIISGTPTKAGEYTFTITAKGMYGNYDSKEFTINVDYAYAIVSGYVKDSNGNPIESATVTLLDKDENTIETTTTDATGKYTFSGEFQYGEHYIKASKENYSETEIEFIVTNSAYQYPNDIILNSYTPYNPDNYYTFKIIEGANSVWEKGSSEGLRFVCEHKGGFITYITIDNIPISSDYYTYSTEYGTIILNASYLETLSLGEHKLFISYLDGMAETTFTIQEASVDPSEPSQNGNDSNPQDSANTQNKTSQNENNSSVQPTDTPLTGDNSFIGFLIGLIGLSMAWAITNRFVRRKRSSK